MDDVSNICLSCGLCCDGTLIGFVHLDGDEIPAVKEVMDIEEADGQGFFLHPCKKYCDGCTIYDQRPKQCGKFKCGLLNSVEQKELDFDSAVETISVVKQKKDAIVQKLAALPFELKSGSFYFQMVELKKVLEKAKSASALTQTHRDLTTDLEQLDMLLLSKFEVTLD